MHLSDEELNVLYDIAYDKMLCGDDEIVYGDGDEAVALRLAVSALRVEAQYRGLWWAQP